MDYVIKLLELATGEPTPMQGKYVKDYVPEIGGPGQLTVTADPGDAKRFWDKVAAFQFWRQNAGVSADGQPNRPLTAWTVDIHPVVETR